jgi:hypothetical protein
MFSTDRELKWELEYAAYDAAFHIVPPAAIVPDDNSLSEYALAQYYECRKGHAHCNRH